MSVYMQTLDLRLDSPNEVTFEYDPTITITDFVVGLSYWGLSFGNQDHHVATFSLRLKPNLEDNGHQVKCKVEALLSDDSGHQLEKFRSDVKLTCIAFSGVSSESIHIQKGEINNKEKSDLESPEWAVTAGGRAPYLSAPILTGWGMSGAEHHVHSISVGAYEDRVVDDDADGEAGSTKLVGRASVKNGKERTGDADWSYIWIKNGQIPSLITTDRLSYDTSEKSEVLTVEKIKQQFPDVGQITNMVAMVEGLYVEFDGDHHFASISGGCTRVDFDGNTGGITPKVSMWDKDHHHQNTKSKVHLRVFATVE